MKDLIVKDADVLNLSIVIPAHNEQENVKMLTEQINDVFGNLDIRYELILVDDGSTDNTLNILRKIKEDYSWLRVITFDRNQGQTAALNAGFAAAQGQIIATLDADLQNDPAEIPLLMELLGDCDAVVGWRKQRQDPWMRKVSTKVANRVRNWLSDENIHDSACPLKVYKRECLENLMLFEGMHRFMPTLVKIQGFKVKEVPVSHFPRNAGKAKYGVWNRLFKSLRDLFAIRWMKKRWLKHYGTEIS